eukprot:scaffold122166_cov28-Phaeocystis_antarctica.AAC.1
MLATENANTNTSTRTQTRTRTRRLLFRLKTSRIQLSGCYPDNQARTFTGGTHQRRCRPSVSHWMLPRVPLVGPRPVR